MQIGNLLSLLVHETYTLAHSDRTNSTEFGRWTHTVRALEHPNEGMCLLCVACIDAPVIQQSAYLGLRLDIFSASLINYVH